jgi:response regulator of citrate/malate metabolism
MTFKEQRIEGKLTDAEVQARLTVSLTHALQRWAMCELIPALRKLSKKPNQTVFVPKTNDKVLELLKQHPKGLTANQLTHHINTSQETISNILKKFYDAKIATRKKVHGAYVYKINQTDSGT